MIKGYIIRLLIVVGLLSTTISACEEMAPHEKLFVAQVGNANLTVSEVRLNVPIGLKGADSLAFVQEYVDNWVNEQILYEQGMRNLTNLPQLEERVRQYRRTLVAQSYEEQMMVQQENWASDEECLRFYEANEKSLKLNQTIVQGLFIKVLNNSSKITQIKSWMKELEQGNTEHLDALEEYCMRRAVAYDNFYDVWTEWIQLRKMLPESANADAVLLQKKQISLRDDNFAYFMLLKDVRKKGDIQPYEYVVNEVRESLLWQKRAEFRKQLQKDLRAEGLQSGMIKINIELEN